MRRKYERGRGRRDSHFSDRFFFGTEAIEPALTIFNALQPPMIGEAGKSVRVALRVSCQFGACFVLERGAVDPGVDLSVGT